MDETSRRRALQIEYNKEHGITPQSIVKAIRRGIEDLSQAKTLEREAVKLNESEFITEEYLNQLEQDMLTAAESLDFEKAAALRDRILELKAQKSGGPARPAASPQGQSARSRARSKKQADNRTKPPRPSIS